MVGKLIKKVIISVLIIVFANLQSFANVRNQEHLLQLDSPRPVTLLVGLKAFELAQQEAPTIAGRKIIEINRTGNWVDAVKKTHAQQIIVKQNSGFVGLYTREGALIRAIEMQDGSNPIQQEAMAPLVEEYQYKEVQDKLGYQTGGLIDPYRPQDYTSIHDDNARLAPGWGYNSQYDKPKSKRSAFVDFINFAPIDVTTPINYAGSFGGNSTISMAYTLGVLPHVGAFLTRMKRGEAEAKDYQYYKTETAVPHYLGETPRYSYYNGARHDETNPINTDPNFPMYSQPPQAFSQAYPYYGQNYHNRLPNFVPGGGVVGN
jgi:hypothetical protein